MKLTELRRSSSQQGGWLFSGTPKRQVKSYFKDCVPEVKYLDRFGIWWVGEKEAVGYLGVFDNFTEVARSAGLLGSGQRQQEQRQEPPKSPPPQLMTPFAAMYLRDNAPKEVVDAAYRALAKLHHPDLAGSNEADRLRRTESMKRLNVAYEAAKKMRGWS